MEVTERSWASVCRLQRRRDAGASHFTAPFTALEKEEKGGGHAVSHLYPGTTKRPVRKWTRYESVFRTTKISAAPPGDERYDRSRCASREPGATGGVRHPEASVEDLVGRRRHSVGHHMTGEPVGRGVEQESRATM